MGISLSEAYELTASVTRLALGAGTTFCKDCHDRQSQGGTHCGMVEVVIRVLSFPTSPALPLVARIVVHNRDGVFYLFHLKDLDDKQTGERLVFVFRFGPEQFHGADYSVRVL